MVNFAIDNALVVKRLSGSEICKNCGAIYHVTNMPSKVKGVCDKCGGPLYTRPDDSLESITNRLEVYRKQTEPLIAFYRARGLLKDIDSSKSQKTPTSRSEGARRFQAGVSGASVCATGPASVASGRAPWQRSAKSRGAAGAAAPAEAGQRGRRGTEKIALLQRSLDLVPLQKPRVSRAAPGLP